MNNMEKRAIEKFLAGDNKLAAGVIMSSDTDYVFLAVIADTTDREQTVAVLSLEEAEKAAMDILTVVEKRKKEKGVYAPGSRKIQ